MSPRAQRGYWMLAWLIWLAVFLLVEVPAACRKAKMDTLSEHVWLWFRGPWRKAILAVFMIVLTCHFVFGWPGGLGVILTGIPVGIVIAYAVWRE